MSTKTTFKRVAAVAALALGLGGLTGVAANAANTYIALSQADGISSFSLANTTGNGVAGPANFVTVGITTASSGIATVSGAGATILSSTNSTREAINTAGSQVVIASSSASDVFTVATPQVGTITVTYYKNVSSGIYSSTATETVVITVNTAASSGVYSAAKSTVYLSTGDTTTVNATTDGAAAATPIVAPKTAFTGTAAASIQVYYVDALEGAVTDSLTATISGPGNIWGTSATTAAGTTHSKSSAADTANLYTATVDAGAKKYATFYVGANGLAGVATVTIKNNAGTVIGTKSLTFSDTTVVSHTVAAGKSYVKASTQTDASPVKTSYVVKLTLKDASGYPVYGVTPTGVAADTTIISSVNCTASTAAGVSYCGVTAGAILGKTTITFTTGSGTTKVTSTADVTVVSGKAASLTISADSSVSNGQVITYTITAKTAEGNPIPDGTLATVYVGSPTVSGGANPDLGSLANGGTTYSAVTALFGNVKFTNGVATDTVQAPFGASTIVADFTNTGTAGVADANLTAALAGVETVISTAVTGDPAAQAAIDAAQEATDAANAAYDAANNAMDSADAATAAAQDAADNASAALAAVTSLSATVAKLVKSVAAIAAALAKVQKKIGA